MVYLAGEDVDFVLSMCDEPVHYGPAHGSGSTSNGDSNHFEMLEGNGEVIKKLRAIYLEVLSC